MTELSIKQQSFIKMMGVSEEHERRGFDLLLQQPGSEKFFDALEQAGFFNPEKNLGPVEADQPGYYTLPYWNPLGYLVALAKLAGERDDTTLAEKVMRIVRRVSTWTDKDGKVRDNDTTWRTFADIVGSAPTSSVKLDDIKLIAIWLGGKFTRSNLGPTITTRVIRRFIDSTKPEDWSKACQIFYQCTTLRWVKDKWTRIPGDKDAVSVIDDYWLKEMINHYAAELGRKAGGELTTVFDGRLREVFEDEDTGNPSYWARAAIEDDPQNVGGEGPEHRFVEGMRNTLNGWVDGNADAARLQIGAYLTDKLGIFRRIAIHEVDQHFDRLRSLLLPALTPDLFDQALLHEVYVLLQRHFREFSEDEKEAVLAAINAIPPPDRGENRDLQRLSDQRRWLSAIVNQGSEQADAWFKHLSENPQIGGLFPHPSYHRYISSGSGFGPTPHKAEELVEFAERGIIVEKLNAFDPPKGWGGPTVKSLSDTLIEAIGREPDLFAKIIPDFLAAKRAYQYSIIAGFKRLWDTLDEKKPPVTDWDALWPKLIEFFEKILFAKDFWNEDIGQVETLTPTRRWIPNIVAEFIRAGVKDDDKAFDPALLKRSWKIIQKLLVKSEPEPKSKEGSGDALNRAINSEKGKAIEALFDQALRWCRLNEAERHSHKEIWQKTLRPAFDKELKKARDKTFEFFALAGAYISNIEFLDREWFSENFAAIFNVAYPEDCFNALDGLAYAPTAGTIYKELVKSGVIEWALKQPKLGERAHDNLLQRMALAYLWKEDDLDSPRFAFLFDQKYEDELREIGRFFWSVREQDLSEDQVEKVRLFWDKCVTWAETVTPPPARLLSSLSLLTCYLDKIGERELKWLMAVAPHVSIDYNADRIIEDLDELADVSPKEVGKVLVVLLSNHEPSYDFEDKLKNLIEKLAGNAASRADALICANKIRNMKGGVELYARLVEQVGDRH